MAKAGLSAGFSTLSNPYSYTGRDLSISAPDIGAAEAMQNAAASGAMMRSRISQAFENLPGLLPMQQVPAAPAAPATPQAASTLPLYNASTNEYAVAGQRIAADDATRLLQSESSIGQPAPPGTDLGPGWRPVTTESYQQMLAGIKDPSFGAMVGKGFEIGTQNLKTLYGSALQSVTGGEYGGGMVKSAETELAKLQPYQRDVAEGITADWFATTLGQQGPMLLESVITALAGAAAGSAAAPGAGTVLGGLAGVLGRKAAKQKILDAAAKYNAAKAAGIAANSTPELIAATKVLKNAGAVAGAVAGSALGNQVIAAGDIYSEGGTPAESWLYGVPYAALDTLVDFAIVSRALGGGRAALPSGATLGQRATEYGVKRFGAGLAVGGLAEGATETGQEAIVLQATEQEMDSPEAINRFLNSFAAGFAVGGLMGGAANLRSRPDTKEETNLLDNPPPQELLALPAPPTPEVLALPAPPLALPAPPVAIPLGGPLAPDYWQQGTLEGFATSRDWANPTLVENNVASALDTLLNTANQWDQQNRSSRSDVWFEGAKVNDTARAGFTEALQNGGENLPAHGMAKERTLSGGIQNLLAILQNGLDPTRRGGMLDYAPLVTPIGSAAQQMSTTPGGSAYSDGPFILVARPGQSFSGKLEGLGAILVNEAHAEIVPYLREVVQAIRPDVLVDSYANAGSVASSLTGISGNRQQGALQFAPPAPSGIGFTEQQPPSLIGQRLLEAQQAQQIANRSAQRAAQQAQDYPLAQAQQQLQLASASEMGGWDAAGSTGLLPTVEPRLTQATQLLLPLEVSGQRVFDQPRPTRAEKLKRGARPAAPTPEVIPATPQELEAAGQMRLFDDEGQTTVAAAKGAGLKRKRPKPKVETGAKQAPPTGKKVDLTVAAKKRAEEAKKAEEAAAKRAEEEAVTVTAEEEALDAEIQEIEETLLGLEADGKKQPTIKYVKELYNRKVISNASLNDARNAYRDRSFGVEDMISAIRSDINDYETEKRNALQKQGADEVSARKGTGTGEEVGPEVRRTEEPPGARKLKPKAKAKKPAAKPVPEEQVAEQVEEEVTPAKKSEAAPAAATEEPVSEKVVAEPSEPVMIQFSLNGDTMTADGREMLRVTNEQLDKYKALLNCLKG